MPAHTLTDYVQSLDSDAQAEAYTRAQLTPFEEIAVFGYENCFVSHDGLATRGSRRAGALCEHFVRLSTSEHIGDAYTKEVEFELDETDASGDPVTATRTVEDTIEWPVALSEDVEPHSDQKIGMTQWFGRGPTEDSITTEWSQVNRAREIAAQFSEGKVVNGELVDGGRALIQEESMILTQTAFEREARNNWLEVDVEEVVDALRLSDEYLERYNYRGRRVEDLSISYTDYLPF